MVTALSIHSGMASLKGICKSSYMVKCSGSGLNGTAEMNDFASLGLYYAALQDVR